MNVMLLIVYNGETARPARGNEMQKVYENATTPQKLENRKAKSG
jgi:hypothetical protein